MHSWPVYIYIYTSVSPCIYMHGVKGSRVKRDRALDRPVSAGPQSFLDSIIEQYLRAASRTRMRPRCRQKTALTGAGRALYGSGGALHSCSGRALGGSGRALGGTGRALGGTGRALGGTGRSEQRKPRTAA